ncbi:MAG: 2,3-bisphosphoglycerate-dependent phosphoglycerate mutase [Candidatus Levyibacteriota bacterium]
MSYLVLVRHGKSQWNKDGLWTGWRDIPLAPEGYEEARRTAAEIKDKHIHFDIAYTSDLIRAQQTLDEVLKIIGQTDIQIIKDPAIKERNYGDYTEKNKWQLKEQFGEDEFQKIRRAWDYPPPNGESLKMVYERTVPYYKQVIEPQLKAGKNVLVSAHGNSLRALVKYLENISDADIENLEFGLGEAYVYRMDSEGKIINKEILGKNPEAGKV